jgi:hypothetical protein
MGVLDLVGRSKENAVYVLVDFHPYMEDKRVVRKLRDLAQSLKASYKTLVILSPVLNLPPNERREITDADLKPASASRCLTCHRSGGVP